MRLKREHLGCFHLFVGVVEIVLAADRPKGQVREPRSARELRGLKPRGRGKAVVQTKEEIEAALERGATLIRNSPLLAQSDLCVSCFSVLRFWFYQKDWPPLKKSGELPRSRSRRESKPNKNALPLRKSCGKDTSLAIL
jgi:hypothetical protein